MKKTFALLILFIISIRSYGQVTQQWTARYNGAYSDEAKVVRADNSGNVYVFGSSDGTNYFDFLTIKYDSLGNVLWQRRYNGPANRDDIGESMELDFEGNIYVTGRSKRIDSFSGYDFCTIKYRPNGDSVWVRRFDGVYSGNDLPVSLIVDRNKNVYITGYSQGYFNIYDILTVKYDSNGALVWSKMYNGTGNDSDSPNSLAIDNNDNIYVSGSSMGIGTGSDFCTIKYNSNGDEQWVVRYNGSQNLSDNIMGMKLDRNGNIIVAGFTTESANHRKLCIIKYNTSGIQQWLKTYSGNFSNDYPACIQTDSLNNIYIAGSTQNSLTEFGIVLIKYSPNGDSLWVEKYLGENPYPASMVLDNTANIYIAGNINEYGTDYLTLKFNTNGEFQWLKIFDGGYTNRDDYASSICLDKNKNVLVTGISNNDNNNYNWAADYLTIKYSQTNPFININLKILFEGIYYNLLNKMLRRDTVQVFLREATAPFTIRDSAKAVIDSNLFNGILTFSNALTGNYYIDVKHFSSIETWSKVGGESYISGYSTYNYDFTNAKNKAFGSNLILKGSKYCIYSGDVNQDGYINLTDVIPIKNDASTFVSGNYIVTDLTGDRIVDLTDVSLCYNNASNFVLSIRP